MLKVPLRHLFHNEIASQGHVSLRREFGQRAGRGLQHRQTSEGAVVSLAHTVLPGIRGQVPCGDRPRGQEGRRLQGYPSDSMYISFCRHQIESCVAV